MMLGGVVQFPVSLSKGWWSKSEVAVTFKEFRFRGPTEPLLGSIICWGCAGNLRDQGKIRKRVMFRVS